MNSSTVKPLFLLADKYAISSLQELCSNYFKRHLSAGTVLDVISFANKLHNQDLSDRLYYMSWNSLKYANYSYVPRLFFHAIYCI